MSSTRYIRIATRFWSDEKIEELSEQARYLYLYILTNQHTNMAGFYRLPAKYIQADLSWNIKQLNKPFQELLSKGLVKQDLTRSIILIPNFLRYNKIQNPNQVKSVQKITEELPDNDLFEEFVDCIKQYVSCDCKGLVKRLGERFTKRLGKPENRIQHTEYRKQNTEDILSSKLDHTSDITAIITFLNDKTGKNYKSGTAKTQKLIKARLNEGFKVPEFYEVIEKKTAEWRNTEFEKYLRPETLFGTKFESYLNQTEPEKKMTQSEMAKILMKKYEEEEKLND
jgi:uncharacterized phage protein (TIGR02220 family)